MKEKTYEWCTCKWRRYFNKLFAYVSNIQESEENTQAFANAGLLHVS